MAPRSDRSPAGSSEGRRPGGNAKANTNAHTNAHAKSGAGDNRAPRPHRTGGSHQAMAENAARPQGKGARNGRKSKPDAHAKQAVAAEIDLADAADGAEADTEAPDLELVNAPAETDAATTAAAAPAGGARAPAPATVETPVYSLDDKRPTVMLRGGAVNRVRFGALWVQNHDIEHKVGYKAPPAGRTVNFVAPMGDFLAVGFFHPVSRIAGRVLTNDPNQAVDRAFFKARLQAAFDLRTALRRLNTTDAYRWVNAEGDGLPGLIVDVYGPWVVVQINCAGFEAQRELLFDLLQEIAKPTGILERRDSGQRRSEGLVSGPAQVVRPEGGALPEPLWLKEGPLAFSVELHSGQKTGMYLDQRDNRRRVGEYVRALHCKKVVDLYCYSGGFGLAARAAGATEVIFVDRSAPAIAAARQAWARNGFAEAEADFQVGPVDEFLRAIPATQKPDWDLVVIDPPKLTQGAIHAHKALQFHRKINAAAFRHVKDGGIVVTCDCSGAVGLADFQEAIAQAAHDAGVRLKLLEVTGGSADHPAPPGFRMGLYLKGLVLELRRN